MINNTGSPFGSLITAMVTPFNDDFSIDMKALERIINYLLSTGTTTIVVNGTTGESPTIDDSELKFLFRFVKEKANGKAKVIGGVGTNSTAKTIKYSHLVEESGLDAVLAVVPYYNKPSQAGQIKHFQEIAKNTSLPMMLYNIPGRTGVNLGVDATLEIIDTCKNVIALKDSTGNTDQAAEIAANVKRNDFWIYSGDDSLTLLYLAVGAAGIVSVASHLIGPTIAKMIDSFFKGDYDEARKTHYQCLPLAKGLFIAPNPTCVKYALSKMGICKATLRLPLVPLTIDEQKKIDAIMAKSPIEKPEAVLSV